MLPKCLDAHRCLFNSFQNECRYLDKEGNRKRDEEKEEKQGIILFDLILIAISPGLRLNVRWVYIRGPIWSSILQECFIITRTRYELSTSCTSLTLRINEDIVGASTALPNRFGVCKKNTFFHLFIPNPSGFNIMPILSKRYATFTMFSIIILSQRSEENDS